MSRESLGTEDSSDRLSSLEKLAGGDSIALGLVNRDLSKVALEGVDDGAAWGDINSHGLYCS